MNYQETIDYLYNALPMFSRMGSAAYKKDLHNIKLLCGELNNPEQSFRSIHVGGTNGKGSVSHMLASIFQAAGYKTGLYTSPHLYDFRERIRINGEMINKDFVVDFVNKNLPIIEKIQPSFFEITVAMAFDYFRKEKVEMAIIEVGLGGRLDSTNIITPELSIITNIGWDHMNLLGNSLPEIAAEKAGIIKKGVPVVIGETQPETAPVFLEEAKNKAAPIYFADENFIAEDLQFLDDGITLHMLDTKKDLIEAYTLDLGGMYQAKNLATVLQAIHVFGKGITIEQVRNGVSKVKKQTGLQGRWELIHREPRVIMDVAHNPEGLQQMVQHLDRLEYKNLHIIIGIVKEKEVASVLRILPGDAAYYFTQAHSPRALDAAQLQEEAHAMGRKGSQYDDVNEALSAAKKNAGKEDLIIVCGSIFLVAEVHRNSEPEFSEFH